MDRFGDQLEAAQTRSPRAKAKAMPARPRRGFRSPALLASLGILLVAAPALAITQPWSPDLGRPGIGTPASTDSSPVSDSAKSVMAVLRRPQTDADRKEPASLLQGIIGEEIQGVQTDSIRSLKAGWALVPAKQVRSAPSEKATDQLCFVNADTTTCGAAANLKDRGINGSDASTTSTTFTGLVPDGVAEVRFTSEGGRVTSTRVGSNFYELRVSEVAPAVMVDAPKGLPNSPDQIPGPPAPVRGKIQWLDSDGKIVGPAGS